jgi:monofunctional biosynthetic peptidoglycan transglycosylase
MTTGPGSGNWSSIYQISPYLVHAVLAHEDASFFSHSGFAPWAIRKALAKNLTQGRFVQGASTISMQLAKNLFLHREKYLARKVQEVLLTWWLETALDKPQILELYLNIIEYGAGLYGITEAANLYFGLEPEDLTPAQSAFLACVLPNPKLYYGQYERNELSESLRNRMRRLLTHMHARGRIDQQALDYGLAELDTFRFHQQGDPLPEPPQVTGSTGPLPFATSQTTGWTEGWEQYADEAFEAAWEAMTPEQL